MTLKYYFSFLLFFFALGVNAQKLELYTNEENPQYLGCLTCPASEQNSLWNHHGTYGNLYNKKSIWNKYGIYGDEKSNFSPWNPYGEKPPIIKRDGQTYGYLTLNKFSGDRVEIGLTKMLYEYYLDIRDDVPKWSDSAAKMSNKENIDSLPAKKYSIEVKQ